LAKGVTEGVIAYKVRGAAYHLRAMRRAFGKGLLMPKGFAKLSKEDRGKEDYRHNRFYWEFEGYLFQFHSAFDMALQLFSQERGLGLGAKDVTWNKVARLAPKDPVIVHLADVRDQYWFKLVTAWRNEVTHRNLSMFTVIATSETKRVEFVAPPGGGGSIFNTCEKYLEYAEDALKEAMRLIKEEHGSGQSTETSQPR